MRGTNETLWWVAGGVAILSAAWWALRSKPEENPKCKPTGTLGGFRYVVIERGREPIVVFHGRGATEAQGIERLQNLNLRTTQRFPRGPLQVGSGAAWTKSRSTDPGFETEMRSLLPQVAVFIQEVTHCYGKPYVIGHSQGANIAFGLASEYPHLIRGAIGSAGALPEAFWTKPFRVPVTVIHGTADTTVPYHRTATMASRKGATFYPIQGADHDYKGSLRQTFETAVTSVAGGAVA